jgi:hypothetical protein
MPRNRTTGSSSLSLFNDKSKNIPDLTRYERKELLSNEKGSHGDRSSKICESAWLHAMYHIGAVLINKNQANGEPLDLDIENNIEDLLLFSGRANKSPEAPHVTKDDLIQRYYQVRPHIAFNGSHVIKNPLHATFVIKIALDHFTPEKIFQCYKKLFKQTINQSISSTMVTLSEHSQLMSCDAAMEILKAYISNNADLFPMVKERDMKLLGHSLTSTYAYDFITGHHSQNGKDCIPALKEILPRFDYSKKLEIDNRLNWRFE